MGSLVCTFWLGNDNINLITAQSQTYNLRVHICLQSDMSNSGCTNNRFAEYRGFAVGDESSNYRLTLNSYMEPPYDTSAHGTEYSYLSNSLIYTGEDSDQVLTNEGIDQMEFSTDDKDNDQSSGNCAEEHQGGWWYNDCGAAFLNSPFVTTYGEDRDPTVASMWWKSGLEEDSVASLRLALQPAENIFGGR